jgi:hypothetical protein
MLNVEMWHPVSTWGSDLRARQGGQPPNESDDLSPFCPLFDVDAVIERRSEVAAERRRRNGGDRPAPRTRGRAADQRTSESAKLDLLLYISPASEKSHRALRAVREVLQDYEPTHVNFSTCDLSVQPEAGDVHSVVFTPTLVTQGAGPRTAIIGNLEHKDVLRDLLDASGVARRLDD